MSAARAGLNMRKVTLANVTFLPRDIFGRLNKCNIAISYSNGSYGAKLSVFVRGKVYVAHSSIIAIILASAKQ